MTGQLRVRPAGEPVGAHTHIIAGLSRGKAQLRFRDVRRFGSATLFSKRALLDGFFEESKLGPEPFDLDVETLMRCLSRTERCLKAVLLNHRPVPAATNIYPPKPLFQPN